MGGTEQGRSCKFVHSLRIREGAPSSTHPTAPCWRVPVIHDGTHGILRTDAQLWRVVGE